MTLSLNNEYGGGLVQKLGKKSTKRWPSLSTDLPTFDEYLLGCGGVPDGRIIEIYGPESAGKTAIACHIIGCAQKAGGLALFVDAEHALDLNHARTLGVDVDNLILSQPDYGEQALEVVLAFVRSRAVRIIVIDSVSALVPKAELDGDMGDSVTFETPVYVRRKGSQIVEIKQVGDLYKKEQTGWYKKTRSWEILTHRGWQSLLGVQKKLNVHKKRIRYTRTTSGYVGTTEDHSLFVGGKEKSPRELKVWDRLDTVSLPAFASMNMCPSSLAWLLGFYVAEGSTPRTKGCNRFEVCNTERLLIEKCQKLILELFGTSGDIRIQKGGGGRQPLYVLQIEATLALGFFMQSCITESLAKQVPYFVLNGTAEVKTNFVDGFWHGDGNHSSSKIRQFFNNSLSVIAGLQTMLPQTTVVVKPTRPKQVTLTESIGASHPAEIRQFYDGDIPRYLYDVCTEAGTFVTLGGIICHNSHMGLQARLMSQAMRKLAGEVSKSGTIVIFINQVRDKIGTTWGNPETTTGGRALKFYSSVRLEVRRLSNTDGGQIIDPDTKDHRGHRMRIKNVKNKVGVPFRETLCDLLYATGFDTRKDMVDYAIMTGVAVEGTKTKADEGNGVPKGWLGFKSENYRRGDLTNEPVFANLSMEAFKARDERLALAAAKAEED